MPIQIFILIGLFALMSGYFLRVEKMVNFLVSFLLLLCISGFATFTPDWFGYELFFTTNDYVKEPVFGFVKMVIANFGGSVKDLHLLYITTYSFILVFLISEFDRRIFIVVILIYPILFIYYTTQIRYFLAYYLACLALYKYYVDRKITVSIVIGILGVLSHYSILLLIPVLFTNKIDISKYAKKMLIWAIIIFVIFFFNAIVVLKFLGLTESYKSYINQSNSSTLFGGLVNFGPLLLIFYFNYRYLKQLIFKYPRLILDRKFLFLYRLAYYPVIFSFISLITQEIGRRFILPSFLFHILILVYLSTRVKNEKFKLWKLIILFSVIYWFYLYYFTQILGSSYIIDTAQKILRSNSKISF